MRCRAAALLEELEASGAGLLSVELTSAETTLASDRDLLVSLIQRASPAAPLPRWGVDSAAHQIVQARLRAALAEAVLFRCVRAPHRFAPPKGLTGTALIVG